MTHAMAKRVTELTEAVLCGDHSNFDELKALLRDSSDARALYLEHATMDPMLRWIYPVEETEVESTVTKGNFTYRGPRMATLAAAAAVVFGALLFWHAPSVRSSAISLTLKNDVRVELVEGAAYELGEPFVLISGEATFLVGETGKGFAVAVPHGRIIDLGTAFSVAVDPKSGEANVRVLSGEVAIEYPDGETSLVAGESGRLLASGWESEVVRPERVASAYDRLIEQSSPVARWSFTGREGAWLADLGSVKLIPGPQGTFGNNNTAAFFGGNGSIRVPDHGESSEFDFAQGDEITLEAWVKLEQPLAANRNVYVIGKGRTQNVGYASENQNFSLRLRGQHDAACVSFLFRSPGSTEDDFHRWTTDAGIQPNHWHHIAISYRFGEPTSVRGYIDGEPSAGTWDMGGATSEPPVVDDDEVWIGSSMGESANNTFPGAIDEVAIYRTQLPRETLAAHATATK